MLNIPFPSDLKVRITLLSTYLLSKSPSTSQSLKPLPSRAKAHTQSIVKLCKDYYISFWIGMYSLSPHYFLPGLWLPGPLVRSQPMGCLLQSELSPIPLVICASNGQRRNPQSHQSRFPILFQQPLLYRSLQKP